MSVNKPLYFNITLLWVGLAAVPSQAYSDPTSHAATSLTSTPEAANPFSQSLPELGSNPTESVEQQEKHLAETARSIGETLQQSADDVSLGQSTRQWLFNQLRDRVTQRVSNEGKQILSPLGHPNLDINVDMSGNFTGTRGSLLTPLKDNADSLTYSELALNQSASGTVGSAGLGQRWGGEQWLFGYNAFIDQLFDINAQRASFGSELWSDFLRLSANYYLPLSGWKQTSSTQLAQMARGYDITSHGYLPFYRQLGVTLSWQQYQGDQVDIFNNGNNIRNPHSVALGVTYTPVPLVTLSATHKDGSGGQSQEQVGLKLNYKFGQSLRQQLSPTEVANANSLLGSRYDGVTRNFTPVISYRQQNELSVFLATPPWQLAVGDTVTLVIQASPDKSIRNIIWHGDTQALSLTQPADNHSLQGWTVIMPPWDSDSPTENRYHLSVTIDNGRQVATSGTITLQAQPPFDVPEPEQPYNLLAP